VRVEAEFPHSRALPEMFGVLARGSGDPAYRRSGTTTWIAGLGPEGPVTIRLRSRTDRVLATFWGSAAEWAADHLADLLGGGDDPRGFIPQHPLIARQWRRYRQTLRVPRTLLTWQTALATVLEQRVTGAQAWSAWRALLTEYGTAAPGPEPLRVPPSPQVVLSIPSWDWRRYGVDTQRAVTVREIARRTHVLVKAQALPPAAARDLLTGIPGVGPWTAAQISARALGDADSVSVGDYHLARNVTFALTGRTDGTDEDMLALLAPYAGHRHRAVRLIEIASVAPPRKGPRMRPPGPGR